jgi:holo-[acyl-carrier protein] synthase
MIVGVGVDIVELSRIEQSIKEYSSDFLSRLFTASEISYCSSRPQPVQHYAARFAAKEALSKAIRTGWSGAFRWTDVEVVNDPSGAPSFVFHNETAKLLEKSNVFLSLSHTDTSAIAFVVIER